MSQPTSKTDAERERLLRLAGEIIVQRGGAALTTAALAARAGMTESNLARWFESQDALMEAMAERWFQPLIAIMEEVRASDLPPRRKMYEFFVRRYRVLRARHGADPVGYANQIDFGDRNFGVIESYIDLADHYLCELIGEAMGEGYFAGLEIDETMSLINQMAHVYCSSTFAHINIERLSEAKLARIIDAAFDGLSGEDRGALGVTGLRAA